MQKPEISDLKKGIQPNFPEPESVGDRPWGKEDLLVLVPKKYMLKRLEIRAGSKGGLQYHRRKDECGVVVSGEMIIRFDDGDGGLTERTVSAGDVFHFPPGSIHQEEAITNCQIIEASTPHFNDRVRVEKLFGIKDTSGLKTTKKSDVKFL